MSLTSDTCSPDMLPDSILLALFMTIATVMSYLPQHIKIFRQKSSRGLNHWTLILALLSCFANIINAFILQYPNVACCKKFVKHF